MEKLIITALISKQNQIKMSHSFNNIWIHAIWSTKHWHPYITQDLENKLYPFIQEQFENMGCRVSIINGTPDHLHCLFWLPPEKSIAEVMKQVKGSSSFYVNQNKLTTQKFGWQTGYGTFSVSKSMMKKVFYYIKNQKRHHANKTSQEEFKEFLTLNKDD
jgi:putative transposase